MTISIIIPTYNESDDIAQLVRYLFHHGKNTEVIVADGESRDKTVSKALQAGAICVSAAKGRAVQMNVGAAQASGKILYFVHADSTPPPTFARDIRQAVTNGFKAGCFRSRFDSDHPLLKINAFMTRFDRILCRGGDQTLFIAKHLFNKLGGYCENQLIMEDFEIIERIQRGASFKIIPKEVIVSARKYSNNSYLQVQLANAVIFAMYKLGYSQKKMIDAYNRLLSLRETWKFPSQSDKVLAK